MSGTMRKFWGGPPAANSASELESLVPRVQEVCTQPFAASLTEQGARRMLRDAVTDLGHRTRYLPEQDRASHLVDYVRQRFQRILESDPFELFAINESGLEGPQEDAGMEGEQAKAVEFTVPVPRSAIEHFPDEVRSWVISHCASMGFLVTISFPPEISEALEASESLTRKAVEETLTRFALAGACADDLDSVFSTSACNEENSRCAGKFIRAEGSSDEATFAEEHEGDGSLTPIAVTIDTAVASAVFSREASLDPSLARAEALMRSVPSSGVLIPCSHGWGQKVHAKDSSLLLGSHGMLARQHARCLLQVQAKSPRISDKGGDDQNISWWLPAALVHSKADEQQSTSELVNITVCPDESTRAIQQIVLENVARNSASKISMFTRTVQLPEPREAVQSALLNELRHWFPDTYIAHRRAAKDDQHFLACGLGAKLVRKWLQGTLIFPFSGKSHPGFVGRALSAIEQSLGCSVGFLSYSPTSCWVHDKIVETSLRTSSADKEHPKGCLLDDNPETYWQTESTLRLRGAAGRSDACHWIEIALPNECHLSRVEMQCGSHSSNFDPVQASVYAAHRSGWRPIATVDLKNQPRKIWITLCSCSEAIRTSIVRVFVTSKTKNVRVNGIRVFTKPLVEGCTHVVVVGPQARRNAVVDALEVERQTCESACRITPSAMAVLRQHEATFIRRSGVRAIKIPEKNTGVVQLVGTVGANGTIAACRRELERLVLFQAKAVQQERITSLRDEIACSLNHIEVQVPLSVHMHKLFSSPAFEAPTFAAPGRRPGSVSILEAMRMQQQENRMQQMQNREGSAFNVVREVRSGGRAGIMERIFMGDAARERDAEEPGNVLAFMLRELRSSRMDDMDNGDITVRAFTLWTQLEEYACDKIEKKILRSAGLALPDDWSTRSSVASMHPGLREGGHLHYFKGGDLSSKQLDGRVIRIAPGVNAQGKARPEFEIAIKAWLGATLEGSCADPGRPSLATLVLENDVKLHNLATRAVAPFAKVDETQAEQEAPQVEDRIREMSVNIIGLKWAALMDEFLLSELSTVLRADIDAFVRKGVGLQALYDAGDRSRHRLLKMLSAAGQLISKLEDELATLQSVAEASGSQNLVTAVKALSAQVKDMAGSWQAALQGSEHDAIRLTDSLMLRIEKANDQKHAKSTCLDQLREISCISGAFVSYSPPNSYLSVKGREKQVRDAISRLRCLMREHTGDDDHEISISLPESAVAQFAQHGGILFELIKLQSGLEHASLDSSGLTFKLRGSQSQLAKAASVLGSMVPPLPELSVKEDAVCLVCLESSPPPLELLCGHFCHAECFQKDHEAKALLASQSGSREPFRCPASSALQGSGGCPHVLTASEVLEVYGGGQSLLEHFEILLERKLQVRPDRRSCTHCGALAVAASDSMPLTCSQCLKSFCGARGGRCGKRAHYFCSCEQFAAAKRRRLGESEMAESSSSSQWPEDIVLCARCHCPIDRQEGANQECKYMRCRLCSYEFCWICLQPADNHRHIDPQDSQRTPECDNVGNQNPSVREKRRLAIIQEDCEALWVPLSRDLIACDRCGTRSHTGKVYNCLECLNSYLCETCEPQGCVIDPSHIIDELDFSREQVVKPESGVNEKKSIPDGFWTEANTQTSSVTLGAAPPLGGSASWAVFQALTGMDRPLHL